MNRRYAWIGVMALIGCGAETPVDPVTVECHAVECPGDDEVSALVGRFGIGEVDEPLLVSWYPPEMVFGGYDGAHGYDPDSAEAHGPQPRSVTISPDEVRVSGFRFLCHELMHVKLWRFEGTPDANHEVAPGPWTDADNDFYKATCSEAGYEPGT
jgi:hypothetical protein